MEIKGNYILYSLAAMAGAIILALALAPILGKRLTDGVGVLDVMLEGEGAVMFLVKNVRIENLPEKDHPHLSLLELDLPIGKWRVRSWGDDLSKLDLRDWKKFLLDDFANGQAFRVSPMVAFTPPNIGDESRRAPVVVNHDAPWPLEVSRLWSININPWRIGIDPGPKQAAADNVGSLLLPRSVVLHFRHLVQVFSNASEFVRGPEQTSGEYGKHDSSERRKNLTGFIERMQETLKPVKYRHAAWMFAGGLLLICLIFAVEALLTFWRKVDKQS